MENRQTDYTIMEGYELPSGGQIYDKPVNPHVELRSMTAKDEMKRLNPSSTPFKNIADIIEGCLIEKPAVHVYDMALGDYEYLLYKLRIVTYGPDYKVEINCPYCGEAISEVVNLDNLNLKEFNLEEFNNLRTFTLPRSGKLVTLNFQTPHMLDTINSKTKEMTRNYKDATIDFGTLVLMKEIIDTVDGEKLSQLELENFINRMPAADLRKIENNIDKMNALVGIQNEIFVTCKNPSCGGETKTFFRYGQEFFRPTTI